MRQLLCAAVSILVCAPVLADFGEVDPSAWTTVAVDPETLSLSDDMGRFLDVAVDPDTSRPFIAYYDENSGNLMLASYVGGSGGCGGGAWDCDAIDITGNVGRYPSIDIHAGVLTWKLGIAYEDVSTGDLKFFERVWSGWPLPGGWSSRTVVVDGPLGTGSSPARYASFAYDSSGEPHIASYVCDDYMTCQLRYSHEVGSGGNCGDGTAAGEWQCDEIDRGLTVGAYASLDLDGDDTPLIAYFDGMHTDLMVAERVEAGAGDCGPSDDWTCTRVDEDGSVGRFASLHASGSGLLRQVHVAYHLRTSSSSGSLKYARLVGSGGTCSNEAWDCSEIEETESADDMGIDLVVAALTPAIAYRGSDGLRLAVESSPGNCGPLVWQGSGWVSSWQCDTLVAGDTSTRLAEGVAMKMDGEGQPFVAYSMAKPLIGARGVRAAYPWIGRDNFESGDTSAWSSIVGEP